MSSNLFYGYTNTLAEPEESTEYICLSPVRDGGVKKEYKYLWVKLHKSWSNPLLSTEDWIEKSIKPLKKYYVKIKLQEDNVQVWFDTSKYNWSQVGTIVSLLRYLGVHKDYLDNYLSVLNKYPKMKHWHAIYCSHKLFGSNWNHAIIRPGVVGNPPIDDFTIEEVISNLDNTEENERAIHKSWRSGTMMGGTIGVGDIPKMFEHPYFLEGE